MRKKKIEWVVSDGGCHVCTSHKSTDSNKYPRAYIDGRHYRLSRYIYSKYYLNGADIAQGFLVRHKCDNPSCINPDHLEIGTPADNISDKIKRGRARYASGESHGISKLKEEDVIYIFNSKETIFKLADRFGVSFQTISRVRRGELWSHLTNKIKHGEHIIGRL
jgi:hypothetical protein